MQIELNSRAFLEHFESDGVLPADIFFLGIDANIQMVVEQIIVRSISSILTTQNVGSRRSRSCRWRRSSRSGWLSCLCGKRCRTKSNRKSRSPKTRVPGPFLHGDTLSSSRLFALQWTFQLVK